MKDIPESEAKKYLNGPLMCQDAEEWNPLATQTGTYEISAGVLDGDGARTALQVQLVYRSTQKTKMTRYIFSVFNRQPWGIERVYQLDIQQSPRPIEVKHNLPHEHFGDRRIDLPKNTGSWSFEDCMKQFSQQTGIVFVPIIEHPLSFELKG